MQDSVGHCRPSSWRRMQGLRTAVLVMVRFVEWVCSQQCAGRELQVDKQQSRQKQH